MKVTLHYHTPLKFCSKAIRTCWDSHDKADPCDSDAEIELIERVGKKYKHESVLEHIVFNFYIEGISRACLQELARHRMASLSVKSTRYTIRKLLKYWNKEKECFVPGFDLSKVCLMTGRTHIDNKLERALAYVCRRLVAGDSNDQVKYLLPESFLTNLAWTINLRSLLNFLELRSSPNALKEIRLLSQEVIKALPKELEPFYQEYKVEII